MPLQGSEYNLDAWKSTFQQLRPVCSKLFEHRKDAKQLAAKLHSLYSILATVEPGGLRYCLDYILVPLVELVDSIEQIRNRKRPVKGDPAKIAFPAARSDKVAEACLRCLELLFQRCKPPASDVKKLVEKLSPILLLPRSAVSEEVSCLTLSCISALLPVWDLQLVSTVEDATAPGFLTQLLLKLARGEAAAGHSGSRLMLTNSLQTLQGLITALLRADRTPALAYLLPGIVSGLCEILSATGVSFGPHARSGPAASPKVAVAALEALVTLLCATIPDEESWASAEAVNGAGGDGMGKTLMALQALQLKMQRGESVRTALSASGRKKGGQATSSPKEAAESFTVDRDKAWRDATAEKLSSRLLVVLPPLQGHPNPTVRTALAEGVVRLLVTCQEGLSPCAPELLEILFVLAQDAWTSVSNSCLVFLRRNCTSVAKAVAIGGRPLRKGVTEEVAFRLLSGLAHALKLGDEEGLQYSQKLVSALQAAGAAAVGRMLADPGKLLAISQALLESFSFESIGAGLLLFAAPQDPGYATLPADAYSQDQEASAGSGKEASLQENGVPGVGAVLFPRMPLGLALIWGEKTYTAAANAVRSLARLASCAGELPLRLLVDCLLGKLRDAAPESYSIEHILVCKQPCLAAAVVTLLSEAVFGASTAWQPSSWVGDEPAKGQSPADLMLLVDEIQCEAKQAGLWSVVTQLPEASSGDEDAHQLTPQELGENAILLRCLLDSVGIFAKALGNSYSTSGQLLRAVLLLVLERLGDHCPNVSRASSDALSSIYLHCQYQGLHDLVAQNTDYIVDGVCAQLRRIDLHPRTPILFAMLLRKSGVAPQLLPLMAEPARMAIRSLGIIARHKRPVHVAAFLAALKEILVAAEVDAGDLLREMTQAADAVAEARTAAAAGNADDDACAHDPEACSCSEAEAFFRGRLEEEAAEKARMSQTVVWRHEDRIAAEKRRQRIHADATLASSAAEAAAPLLTSRTFQVVLLAIDVSTIAIQVLQRTSAALRSEETQIEPFVEKSETLQPTSPQLLPHIHQLWNPLMNSLQDGRIAVLERSLKTLASLAAAAAGFLTRRMTAEAWPQLRRLLREGPMRQADAQSSAALQEDSKQHAPAVLLRARQAVLSCICSIASSEEGRPTVKGIVSEATEAALSFVAGSHPTALKSQARQVIARLGLVDSDVVWLHLVRAKGQAGINLIQPGSNSLRPIADIFPNIAMTSRPMDGFGAVADSLLQEIEKSEPIWMRTVQSRGGPSQAC